MPVYSQTPSKTALPPTDVRPEFALTTVEQDVIRAVVTKFAADLVLTRLAKPIPAGEAAALEEVATAAAVMLNEKREPALIETLAVQAIIESVSTGAEDAFFEALSASGAVGFRPVRLKHVVRVIHGKIVAAGFSAAA